MDGAPREYPEFLHCGSRGPWQEHTSRPAHGVNRYLAYDSTFKHTRVLCPGCLPSDADNRQVLDQLPVERARGITVKAQVRLYS